MEEQKNSASVQSIDRAFRILETLAEHPQGLALAELVELLHLNKTTIHRILQTLVEWGYVAKNEKRKCYRLGMKTVALSSAYLGGLELKTEALPFLEQLQKKTGLFVHLGVLDGKDVVYLEKLGPLTRLRMYSQIGRRTTLYSTSLGKAMFAWLDEGAQEALLIEMELLPLTGKTITDAERFRCDISATRERGYALDDEENEVGMRCVGAPVFDYTGRVIAAISISGHTTTFLPEKIGEYGGYAVDCANAVSAQMGYQPQASRANRYQ